MDKITANNGRNIPPNAHHPQQHQHGASNQGGTNRQSRPNSNSANHPQYNHQQPTQAAPQQRQRVPQNSQPQQRGPSQIQQQHPQNMNHNQTSQNQVQGRPSNSRGPANRQQRPSGQQPHHSTNSNSTDSRQQQQRQGGRNSPSTLTRTHTQTGQTRPNSTSQPRLNPQGVSNGTSQPPGPPLPNVLPKGWKKKEIVRTKGITAGLVDVVYVPSSSASDLPADKKFHSKLELHRYFGNRYDMSLLDYRSGKLSQVNWRKARRNKSLAANNTNYASAAKYDNYLNLPIRQTASIFKQSVTYKTNNHNNEPTPAHVLDVATNKATDKPKPSQLFWEMSFNDLVAVDSRYMGEENKDLKKEFELNNIPKFENFPLSNENVIRSVASSWYLNQTKSLLGQEKEFTKNARVFIDREQPLIPQTTVKEADIKVQEQILKDIRLRIEAAIKELEHIDYMSLEEIEASEEVEAKPKKIEEVKKELETKVEAKELVIL